MPSAICWWRRRDGRAPNDNGWRIVCLKRDTREGCYSRNLPGNQTLSTFWRAQNQSSYKHFAPLKGCKCQEVKRIRTYLRDRGRQRSRRRRCPLRENKKRRQCSDDVPALKRTVAAFRPWRINSITSHHLNTAFLNGEGGIRTHDTLLRYTRFPIARLRPLGHLSRKQRRRKRDSNP